MGSAAVTLVEECIARGVAPSKRGLSRLLGRSENYMCEIGGFRAEDLVHLRLYLLEIGGHDDLAARAEQMLLEPWR